MHVTRKLHPNKNSTRLPRDMTGLRAPRAITGWRIHGSTWKKSATMSQSAAVVVPELNATDPWYASLHGTV